ncbi:hypothetical protein T484DRAFT_1923527, partial [Baffinella frigidus]
MASGQENRRGGLPILRVNGTLLCGHFMRGKCGASGCVSLHIPKEERPPCPNFEQCGACKFAADCWYPHRPRTSAAGELGERVNLGLQVHKTHLSRFEDFLASQPGITVCGKAQLPVGVKSDHLTILLRADDPSAFAEVLREERFRTALARIYPLSNRHADLDTAVQGAIAEIEPVEGKTFRIQAFPKALERQLGDGPASVSVTHKLALTAKGHTHLLSVVCSDEVYYVGVALREEAPAVDWDQRDSQAICKAYFKMQEALVTSSLSSDIATDRDAGRAWVALDVGASPGGWSQCLMQHGCERVVAIDPGDVATLPGVEHLRCKLQDAVPLLRERGEQADLFVSDVNCSPSEAVEMLLLCLPILRPGARVILTFKKFSGEGKCTSSSFK